MTSTIAQRLQALIVDELGVDADLVTLDASFSEDLGADSLDTAKVLVRTEEEFGIEIPAEDAAKMTRVRYALDYLESHVTS